MNPVMLFSTRINEYCKPLAAISVSKLNLASASALSLSSANFRASVSRLTASNASNSNLCFSSKYSFCCCSAINVKLSAMRKFGMMMKCVGLGIVSSARTFFSENCLGGYSCLRFFFKPFSRR
jgi:hypothetical protein